MRPHRHEPVGRILVTLANEAKRATFLRFRLAIGCDRTRVVLKFGARQYLPARWTSRSGRHHTTRAKPQRAAVAPSVARCRSLRNSAKRAERPARAPAGQEDRYAGARRSTFRNAHAFASFRCGPDDPHPSWFSITSRPSPPSSLRVSGSISTNSFPSSLLDPGWAFRSSTTVTSSFRCPFANRLFFLAWSRALTPVKGLKASAVRDSRAVPVQIAFSTS